MASVEVTVCPNWINNFCPLGIGAIIGGVAIIEQTEVKKKKKYFSDRTNFVSSVETSVVCFCFLASEQAWLYV